VELAEDRMTRLNRLWGKPEGDLADDSWSEVPFASPLALLNVDDRKRVAPSKAKTWVDRPDPVDTGWNLEAQSDADPMSLRRLAKAYTTFDLDDNKRDLPQEVQAWLDVEPEPEEEDWDAAIRLAKGSGTIELKAIAGAPTAPAPAATTQDEPDWDAAIAKAKATATPAAPVAKPPVAKAPVAPVAKAPTPASTSSLSARIQGAMGRLEDEVRQRGKKASAG
jgi:hypothetical protein